MMLISTVQHADGMITKVVTTLKNGSCLCVVYYEGAVDSFYEFESDDKNVAERYHMETVESLQ